MNYWIDGVLLVFVAVGGISLLLLMVRHHPQWVFIRDIVLKTAVPLIVEYITRRNTPKVEEKLLQSTRRAQEWDNFNKRPKDK